MKFRLVIFFFLFFSTVAGAESPITIVRGQDYPPYHFMDTSGNPSGFIIDIIEAVAHDMGIQVAFEQYPWSRCLRMVKLGRADAMMNLFRTEERQQFMYFSDNVLAYEVNQLFCLKQEGLSYNGDISALSSTKIGAIRNYSYGPVFDGATLDRVFRLETETDLIKALVKGRCEVIVGNNLVINGLIKKMGFDDLVAPMFPIISKAPLYIGFSKARNHKELSDQFSKALFQLKKNGTHDSILKKYH